MAMDSNESAGGKIILNLVYQRKKICRIDAVDLDQNKELES